MLKQTKKVGADLTDLGLCHKKSLNQNLILSNGHHLYSTDHSPLFPFISSVKMKKREKCVMCKLVEYLNREKKVPTNQNAIICV